jgi:hypothetical protein
MVIHDNPAACGSPQYLPLTDSAAYNRTLSHCTVEAIVDGSSGILNDYAVSGNCDASKVTLDSDIFDYATKGKPGAEQGEQEKRLTAQLEDGFEKFAADDNKHKLRKHIHSEKGYRYFAEYLAKKGYIVVSILAQRAITGIDGGGDPITKNVINHDAGDPRGYLAWGRMGLATFELLQHWDEHGGTPENGGGADADTLRGHFDFQEAGLVGHSRGGMAVRVILNALGNGGSLPPNPKAAGGAVESAVESVGSAVVDPSMNMAYVDLPDVTIKAVFEIAPMDEQEQTGGKNGTYDANGVPWAVLLPTCDGDVNELAGRCPYDRVMAEHDATSSLPEHSKTTWWVHGTSHNAFNSQWQAADGRVCFNAQPLFPGISGWNQPGADRDAAPIGKPTDHFFLWW